VSPQQRVSRFDRQLDSGKNWIYKKTELARIWALNLTFSLEIAEDNSRIPKIQQYTVVGTDCQVWGKGHIDVRWAST
jgi:hypothetical protein